MNIEKVRAELNNAAANDIASEQCFQLSLELDELLEQYYSQEKPAECG